MVPTVIACHKNPKLLPPLETQVPGLWDKGKLEFSRSLGLLSTLQSRPVPVTEPRPITQPTQTGSAM